MSNIDKEWLKQKIADMEAARDEILFGLDEDDSNTLAALRIALASLEAKSRKLFTCSGCGAEGLDEPLESKCHCNEDGAHWVESVVYTAPPAPVSVPEHIRRNDADGWLMYKGRRVGGGCAEWYNRALDDCRAAMLQGADVSLTHEGKNHHEDKLGMVNHLGDVTEKVEPVTQIEPVADLYGLTSSTGGETSFTFDAVEARDFIDGGWSCQEYVELERFQEAITNHTEDKLAMVDHSGDSNNMVERVSQSYKLPEEKGASLQLRNLIRKRHAEWSDSTFGNVGPIGPLKHLSKEALEAAAEPDDLSEWADMQFLLWDAQRRAGISDGEITAAMEEKLKVNMARQWPEPKDGEPRLHIKAAPQQEVTQALAKGMERYGDAMQKLADSGD